MDTKIVLPKTICDDDVIAYIAGRYKTTPLAVITCFLRHEGILSGQSAEIFSLEENEIAICRALGIAPSQIEITENKKI